jgi:hypothetical protein
MQFAISRLNRLDLSPGGEAADAASTARAALNRLNSSPAREG